MRQRVVADAVLDAKSVAHVPVVHGKERDGLIHVVADVLRLKLGVIGGEPKQEVQVGIAGEPACGRTRLVLSQPSLMVKKPFVLPNICWFLV